MDSTGSPVYETDPLVHARKAGITKAWIDVTGSLPDPDVVVIGEFVQVGAPRGSLLKDPDLLARFMKEAGLSFKWHNSHGYVFLDTTRPAPPEPGYQWEKYKADYKNEQDGLKKNLSRRMEIEHEIFSAEEEEEEEAEREGRAP